MIEIIPSINAQTFTEVQERVKKVEPYVSWCHLDVTDGIFSAYPTWNNSRDLSSLRTKLKCEAHLMIAEPEKVIDQWLVKPIKRVIVHWEATRDFDLIIQKCRNAGIEIGLAINSETSWEKLEPWFGKVDMVQILAVNPGPSGQKMGEEILEKVRSVRNICPQCIIEVDGGINTDTAKKVKETGANILVAGSVIFSGENIREIILQLAS